MSISCLLKELIDFKFSSKFEVVSFQSQSIFFIFSVKSMFDLKLLHIALISRSVVIQTTSIDLLVRLGVIILLLDQMGHIVALLTLAQIYIGATW